MQFRKNRGGVPTNRKIFLNGKTYSEDYLYEPTHGDLECDFYNLAFAAIVEWKKKKAQKAAKEKKLTNRLRERICEF